MSIKIKVTVYNWLLTLLILIPFLITWFIGMIWSILDYYYVLFKHRVINKTTCFIHAEMLRLLNTSGYYAIPIALSNWKLKKTTLYKTRLERNVI
jgi:hypothetical protein